MTTSAVCAFEGSKYLLFSSNVPPLVYYSHIPVVIISLILGFFVFFKNKKGLLNRIILCLTLAFSTWVFLDSIFWASNRSDVIMFVWSVVILFEPIVYISALYLLYVLIKKEDTSFNKKLLIGLIYLPIIILVPTKFSLSSFNIATCLSEESSIIIYLSYGTEILLTLWIIVFSIKEFIKTKIKETKHQILVLTTGTIFLLLSFSSGNIISSFTEDWRFAQIGLFAMPVFIAFLAYSVVRFKTFNIKLIGANVLVAGLWMLTGSLLFLNNLSVMRIVVSVTLLITIFFGILLIKSVRKEVRQRELIEKLAEDLQKANDRLKELDKQKTEFVSFATHQLRSPLTAMRGYASLILEGDMGEVTPKVKEAVEKISDSSKTLASVVNDYLDISRIELGTMKYNFVKIDWKKMIEDTLAELKPTIDKSGLAINFTADSNNTYIIEADLDKFKQVIGNLIDNSIKYTPQGNVDVSLVKNNAGKIIFAIKDTGIGIAEKTIPKLFQKFTRDKKANETNIHGTGLGLYVAKEVVASHKGKIWAESAGEGKGSQFYVEMKGE
ncbi:MAG: ATP-binding protein [Patescibacteria group bacterium]|nr:ATP-binding protein [Patescibacteria group bacterium]